jgi:hypothetical protein
MGGKPGFPLYVTCGFDLQFDNCNGYRNGGRSEMREPHHPTISRYDERCVVDCPECRRAAQWRQGGFGELAIGIGMPLESCVTAERLRDNHMGWWYFNSADPAGVPRPNPQSETGVA